MMIQDVAYIVGAFTLYSIQHSFFASNTAKDFFKRHFPRSLFAYRLIYNITQIVLLLVLWIYLPRPAYVLYKVEGPASWAFRAGQLIGLVGFIFSLLQFDLGEFSGIRQIKRFLRKSRDAQRVEKSALNVGGLYRYMRHPLYFFSILYFLFKPRMTLFDFLLLLWLIIYFYVGSIFEERRLEDEFGEAYVRYRERVNRFLPTWSVIWQDLKHRRA